MIARFESRELASSTSEAPFAPARRLIRNSFRYSSRYGNVQAIICSLNILLCGQLPITLLYRQLPPEIRLQERAS
jgi:hypothetical protein